MFLQWRFSLSSEQCSDGGIVVSIAAFQAVDPGLIRSSELFSCVLQCTGLK